MKKAGALLCLCSLLAVAGSAATRAAQPSAAAQVRGLILQQTKLFNEARWSAAWTTYTLRVRSRCNYVRWRAAQQQARRELGRIVTRNIRVSVTRNRARASYRIVARGRVVASATRRRPDVYVRIGGRWYDAEDAHTGC